MKGHLIPSQFRSKSYRLIIIVVADYVSIVLLFFFFFCVCYCFFGCGSSGGVIEAENAKGEGGVWRRSVSLFAVYIFPLILNNVVVFRFQVEVQDPSGQSATADITIFLNDVNDNTPVFDQTSYQFKVSMRLGW